MAAAGLPRPMRVLPCPGQKVRWRNPQQARDWGWQDVFGSGPFRVEGLVDHSDRSMPTGLLLHTKLGEREISELWLALEDEVEVDTSRRRQPVGTIAEPQGQAAAPN